MHRVLHDWTDDKAILILKNQAEAMEKHYSKLLIFESVVSSDDKNPHVTIADLTMMMIASSKERTEKMWRELLAEAGLRVQKICSIPGAAESVIEAELA